MHDKPRRKTPTHLPVLEFLGHPTIVFLTVCAEKRKRILCRDSVHRLLIETWGRANTWLIGRYVLMPDHLHLFCAPGVDECPPLSQWVRFWKSMVSRQWPWPQEQPIWQKSFWDTQLRQGESYAEKWEYVRQNPVRKGYVSDPESWAYQGELNELR